jgi:Leucine-rich repeat (LRR) protein
MLNPGLITFLALVVWQISSETCRDSSGVTVCVGLTLKPTHKLNITTSRTKLCILHGDNSVIPDESFTMLTQLDGLYFNTTNVRKINLNAFTGLPHLKTLGFFGNKISTIEDAVFLECGALETLDLTGNDIEFLNTINWVGLEKLKNLYVVHNFVRTIPNVGLEPLRDLEYLDLSLNYLESLNSFSFQVFKNLIKLNLAYNRIKTIEDDAFNGLAKLEELHFEGNQLKEIRIKNVVENLVNIKRIRLDQNKFSCEEFRRNTNNTDLILCNLRN